MIEQNNRPELPVTVDRISVQKKNSNRFSLYGKTGFICGVSTDTLLKLQLAKGTVIDASLFEQIRMVEDREKIRNYLFDLLSRRSHAGGELFDKAVKKGFDTGIINELIDELKEKNYINDPDFACRFAVDKLRLNQWGPLKISAELLKKSIDKQVAETAIQKAVEEVNPEQICVRLIQKKKRKFLSEKDTFRRKQKIFAYFMRKGFKLETIKTALKSVSFIQDV